MEYYLSKDCKELCADWSKRRELSLGDVQGKIKRLRTGEFMPLHSDDDRLLSVLHFPLEVESSDPVKFIERGHDALKKMRFELSGETKWYSILDFAGQGALNLFYIDQHLTWQGIGRIFSVASRLPVEPRVALLMVMSLRFKTGGLLLMRHFGILQQDIQMCMCGRIEECECGVSNCAKTHLFSEEELQESGAAFVGQPIARDDGYLDAAQRMTAVVCQRILHPSYNDFIYDGAHSFHDLAPRHDQTREHIAVSLAECRQAFLDGVVYLTAEMRFGKTRVAGALIKTLCSEAQGAGCDCAGTKRLASESVASDDHATHCLVSSYQKILVNKWKAEVSQTLGDVSRCKFLKHTDLCTEFASLANTAKSIMLVIDEWHLVSKSIAKSLGEMMRKYREEHGPGSLHVVLVSATPLAKGLDSSRVHLNLVGKGRFCEHSFLESSQHQHMIVNLSVSEIVTHCSNTFLESGDTCQLPGLYLHKRERLSNIKCFSRTSTTQAFKEMFAVDDTGKSKLQLDINLFKCWPRVIKNEEFDAVIDTLHGVYPGTMENGYSTQQVVDNAQFLVCEPVDEICAVHENVMEFGRVIREARAAAFNSMENQGYSQRVVRSFRELCQGMEKAVSKLQSRLARASSMREIETVRVASERMLDAFKVKYDRFIHGDGMELLQAIHKVAECAVKPLNRAPIFPGVSGSDEEYHCPVCFDAEVSVVTPCHHTLCNDCFKMIATLCPTCRSPLFPQGVDAGTHGVPVLIDLAAWKLCVSKYGAPEVLCRYNEMVAAAGAQPKPAGRSRFSFTPSISEQDVFLQRGYRELASFLKDNITKRVVIFASRSVVNDMRKLFPVCSSDGQELRLVSSLDTFNGSAEKPMVFASTWFLSTAVTIIADIVVFFQVPNNAGTCKQALARTKIRNCPDKMPQLVVMCVNNRSWRQGYQNLCGISCRN